MPGPASPFPCAFSWLHSLALSVLLAFSVGCTGGSGSSSDVANPGKDDTLAPLVSIQIHGDATEVAPGEVVGFVAIGSYGDGTTRGLTSEVVWHNSVPSTGSFVEDGVFLAGAPGETLVTAREAGLVSNSFGVVVSEPTLTDLVLLVPSTELEVGSSVSATVSGVYSDGSSHPVTGEVQWTVSSPGVLGVTTGDPAVLAGLSEGAASVTVTLDGVGSDPVTFTVMAPAPAPTLVSLELQGPAGPLAVGEAAAISLTAVFSDGSNQDVTDAAEWVLSDPAVVGVQSGPPVIVIGLEAGSAEVTGRWLETDSNALALEVIDGGDPELVVRMNAGGDELDVAGESFSADASFDGVQPGFTGGGAYTTSEPIAGTSDDALYQSQRYGQFGFRALVPPGSYRIELHYAEIYGPFGPGNRVFDVSIEGQVVDDDLDVADEVGPGTALIRTHFVTVNDGLLEIDWQASIDNAIVNGVSLESVGDLPDPEVVSVSVSPEILAVEPDGTASLVAMAQVTVGPPQDVTEQATWTSSDPTVVIFDQPGLVHGVALGTATVTVTHDGFSATSEVTVTELGVTVNVGDPQHSWNPKLGGVVWLPTRAAAMAHADVFEEYEGDVLLSIKPNEHSFGYRFDLDSWDPNVNVYGWFAWDGTDEGEPPNLDQFFQIYGRPNVQFQLTLPMPETLVANPGAGNQGYLWQTADFYAAQCQYLFGVAGPVSEYENLPENLDFFDQPQSFNWANLRARRGHVEPYSCVSVMLAGEPYYGEGWGSDGGAYGARAEIYRQRIRARGLTDLPYGVHVSHHPPQGGSWFDPMFDQLSTEDPPTQLDLYHFYTLPAADDWERAYPVAVKTEGFQFWWQDPSQWQSDYSQFLWLFEDTRKALENRGLAPEDYELGFSEHGILLSTPFQLNDMKAACHWALWLSEMMRLGAAWDSMWTLVAEGYATAQIQYVGGHTTRTPAFYVYQLAMKLRGLTYLHTEVGSPEGNTVSKAVWGNDSPVTFPWVVVRVFENPEDGTRHLFVVNHHPTSPFTLTGLGGWQISEWEELHADSYLAQNPLGQPGPEPLQPLEISKSPGDPLTVAPISITRIVLAPSGS